VDAASILVLPSLETTPNNAKIAQKQDKRWEAMKKNDEQP